MSRKFLSGCLLISAVCALGPDGVTGQAGAQGTSDSLALAFEREVFVYPEYARRNPFRTLLSADDGGPRFESLLLLGILFSPFADESVALFGEGSRAVDEAGIITVELTGDTYRVREGDTLGSVTIRLIERAQVTVELVEFGLTESRVVELSR